VKSFAPETKIPDRKVWKPRVYSDPDSDIHSPTTQSYTQWSN